MAKSKTVTSISTRGEWLDRDLKGWRVRVPCQGGHGYFSFEEYGGSVKALNAARAFHAKMERQYRKDLEYKKEHGELPKRQTVNIRNRTGIPGVSREVYPSLNGSATIVWTAYWNRNGKQFCQHFSTASYEHKNEAECKRKAIEKRKEMTEGKWQK